MRHISAKSLGRMASWVIGVAVLGGSTADAQTGSVLSGRVFADTTGIPLSKAEISMPAHSRTVFADDSGRYRLTDIPPGRQEIIVRHVGYSPHVIHYTFALSDSVERDVSLQRVQFLEEVTVQATNVIPSFEENRRIGLGQFVTRAELAKQENRKVADVITQLRGVKLWRGSSGRTHLYSNRRPITSIMNSRRAESIDGAPGDACYTQVWLDDAVIYRGAEREPLFDLNSIPLSSIEAIEYYSGPSSTPLKYSKLNSQCGVLVIHTRRTP